MAFSSSLVLRNGVKSCVIFWCMSRDFWTGLQFMYSPSANLQLYICIFMLIIYSYFHLRDTDVVRCAGALGQFGKIRELEAFRICPGLLGLTIHCWSIGWMACFRTSNPISKYVALSLIYVNYNDTYSTLTQIMITLKHDLNDKNSNEK